MALTYRIDQAEGIVTILGDYADAAAWRGLLGAVASDPEFRRGFNFLRDLRASAHPVSAETVIEIIRVVGEYWGRLGARRAAIVTKPGLNDPALMAHALADADRIPLRAFTSYEDAVKWLREE